MKTLLYWIFRPFIVSLGVGILLLITFNIIVLSLCAKFVYFTDEVYDYLPVSLKQPTAIIDKS